MNHLFKMPAFALALCLAGCTNLPGRGVSDTVGLQYEDLADREAGTAEPGKEYRIGVSGVCGRIKDDHILVTHVVKGSPADGRIRKRDLIRKLQYRSVGNGTEGIKQTVVKRIYRLGRDWDWHLYVTVERPNLRKGKGHLLTYDLVMPRPSDKQYHFGPTGFFGKIHPGFIEVDHVAKGSPSDGKLKNGDRIIAVDGVPMQGEVFALFTKHVDIAESSEGGGLLELSILRPLTAPTDSPEDAPVEPVKPQQVRLQLEVLGTYSPTSPIDCPKTDKIIEQTADRIIETGKYGKLDTDLIALLATGEQKHIDHVRKVIHASEWARPDVELSMNSGKVSWPYAYHTIILCEYYLLTEDKYVLPAINAYAKIIARGQDAAGLWNHRMAAPEANFGKLHGRLYGYGAINQTSAALWIGLILAEECGVKDPEVRMAVEKTYKLYSYWIDRGRLPYGNHDADEGFFTNNGTSGSAAVGFALLGDRKGANFFSRMSAAAGREVLTGHTGPWFNIFWSGIGANVAGPELTKEYNRELHWLRTVTRTWDNKFLHMEAWGCTPGDHGLGSSGSTLLNLAASRRKLRITGRDMDKSLWLDRKTAGETVAAGSIDYTSLKIDELIDLLGHPLPPVRLRASEMLAINDAEIEDEIMDMLRHGTHEQRIGAIHGVEALKIPAVDALMAIVRDEKDDLWIRQLALRTMCSFEGSVKHTPELLDILAGDKNYDVQGRFDEYLGNALVKLTGSDPYSANLDRDLLYSSIRKLLDHKRQEARGSGMSLLRKIPLADLHRVAEKMIYVIEDKDRTYVSYHGDSHRQTGLDILYGLNIDESLDLTVNTINEKVGRGWRKRNRVAFMKTWGTEAKRMIPEIRDILGKEADEYVRIIEEAETGKKMITLKEALNAAE